VPRLPVPVTRFFGREPELEQLALWLCDPAVRLITLTGAGGAGKTRLAIEAATRAVADEGTDAPKLCGPWFVPLSDRADAPAIVDALADAILLPAAGDRPLLDQTIAYLTHAGRSSPCLLILDNFEHLIDPGAALVATLIERVPNLKCIVTSRQLLEIAGEHELAVLPLPVPGGQVFEHSGIQAHQGGPAVDPAGPEHLNTRTPEQLLRFPSVQLFLDRARASRPDFAVTPRNAAAVASLCERLEGMPLALELAAARAQMLTPSQMLTQLEARFDFLVSRRRDIPPRHRSLRAAMAWSYELLSPDLRRFFARLSVFKGRWTLEAAEAVCRDFEPQINADEHRLKTDTGERPDARPPHPRPSAFICGSTVGRAAALDYLTELRERSLILVIEGDEEMAYRMLETLREYAAEQLDPAEQAALRRRHAEFYLALAEEAGKHLHGPQQGEWLDHLEADHDNFRAALAWSRDDTGARETGLRLTGLLHFFWYVRNHVSEGRRWLTELLPASAEAEPTAALASALYGAAGLAAAQGDLTAAAWHYSQCLEIRRELGDQQGIADTLCQWGYVADRMGDRMAARSLFAQSEVIYRAIGDKGGLAHALKCIGAAALTEGELDRARVLFEESVGLYRELQNARGLAMMLGEMAHLALLQAEYERASVLLREHIELSRQLKDTGHIALALRNLAYAVRNEGDQPGAQALFEESLALWRDLGEKHQIAEILIQIGSLQWLQGQAAAARQSFERGLTVLREVRDPKTLSGCLELLASVALGPATSDVPAAAAACSARLFAAAEAFRAQVDAPGLWPAEREARERALSLIRSALGDEGLEKAWTEGRTLTVAHAIDAAGGIDL
jgi:predicted ATPase